MRRVRLGIIELCLLDRYRPPAARTLRWQPHGPGMACFHEHVVGDFFSAESETAPEHVRPCTLVVGMRSWLFSVFGDLRHDPAVPLLDAD